MAALIYSLCALAALVCAFLLLRAYFRSRYRLLLWSGLCFCGLTMNNVLLVLDKVAFPDINFSPWRAVSAAVAMAVLLYGLIWDAES
ncbi:MAG TPA: DUF5985 family protein [Dongiaceae bacterium]|jgi:hypothetical protein|nr:DUF5985 family protein [Dongiaceae bacterium]